MDQRTLRRFPQTIAWLVSFHVALISSISAQEAPPLEFVGKQRTVPELVQMMKAHRPTPTQLDKHRIVASTAPSVTLKGDQLADFYVERAIAARSIGLTQQSISDLNLAVQAYGPTYSFAKVHAINLLTHSQCGAKSTLNDSTADVLRDSPEGNTAYLLTKKITYGIIKGDVSTAEMGLKELKNHLAELRPNQNDDRVYTLDSIAFASYSIARLQGKFPEARAFLQASVFSTHNIVKHLEELVRTSPVRPGLQGQLLGFRAQLLSRRQLFADILIAGDLLQAEWEATNSLIDALQNPAVFWNGVSNAAVTLAHVLSTQGRHENAKLLVSEARSASLVNHDGGCSLTFLSDSIEIEAAMHEGDFKRAANLTRSTLAGIDAEDFGPPVNRLRERWMVALLLDHDYSSAKKVVEGAIRRLDTSRIGNIPERTRYGFYASLIELQGSAAQEQIDQLGGYIFNGIARQIDTLGWGDKRNEAYKQRLNFILDYYLNLLAELAPTQARNAQALTIAQLTSSLNQPNGLIANLRRDTNIASEKHAMVRRIQDMRLEIEAYQHAANNLAGEAALPNKNRALQLKIEAQNLWEKRSVLLQEYRAKYNATFPLDADRKTPVAAALDALKPSEAILIYKSHASYTDIWFLKSGKNSEWVRITLSKEKLKSLISKVRDSVDPHQWLAASPSTFATDQAQALHQHLIAPFAKNLEGTEKIVVIADDIFTSLPFELLVEPVPENHQNSSYQNLPWLVKKYAFTYLPSIESFAYLRAREKPTFNRQFVGIGDPIFGAKTASLSTTSFRQGFVGGLGRDAILSTSDLPALPDTGIELNAISKVFKLPRDGNVFLQAHANKVLVKSGVLEKVKVISFATHSLHSGDVPGLFEPALALSAHPQDALDNLLRASEISQLKLTADWVVLSACNSASVSATSQSTINGLADAFFYAGARALLVTHWAVDTTAARDLMINTFENYIKGGEKDKSGSLRKAILTMISDENRAHPFFWAPFAVLGD
jgi:CHAT domain-containing protein